MEESMETQVREMHMSQREVHKKQRTLDVELASLEKKQSVCNATEARLVHERKLLGAERVQIKGSLTTARHRRQGERKVSFIGCGEEACDVSFHA
jgi:hypothetical protein